MVEKKQREIRGNVVSVKLSPEACAQEVKDIVPPELKEHKFPPGGYRLGEREIELIRTENTIGGELPRKRGRPKGSRNKVKAAGEK